MGPHHTPLIHPDDEINILEIWHFVRDGWTAIAVASAAGLVVGLTLAFTTDPVYRASTVIIEAAGLGGGGDGASELLGRFGGLASLAGVDLSSPATRGRMGQAILHSRSLAEEFVRRNELWPDLYPDLWDSAAGRWRDEVTDPPELAQAGSALQGALNISTARDVPGAIVLEVEWDDPQIAAQWANGLIALANEFARQRDVTHASRTIEFLTGQIQQTNVLELQRVLYNLLEMEQKTLMLANARDEYAFEVIDPAVPVRTPVRPNRMLLVAAGIGAGFALGIAAAWAGRVRRTIVEQSGRA